VGYNPIDAVQLLLQKGLEPTKMDIFWKLRASENTGGRTAIELIVGAGRDINRPANKHTAPLLGRVKDLTYLIADFLLIQPKMSCQRS
jgi:hypothetical protein